MKNIKFKRKMLYALILMIFSLVLAYANYFAIENYLGDESMQGKIEQLDKQVLSINESIAKIEDRISLTGVILDDFSEDSYNQIIANSANYNNLSFTKYKNNEVTAQNSVSSINIQFEVYGTLENINSFVGEFKNYPCIIQNISLKQDNELLWNVRNYDNTDVLSWIYINDEKESITEEVGEITNEILTDQSEMHFFVEIEFFGREVR
ncbi:MAG: hypothetical protein R3Y09_03650 [Clostridia bacterium]